MTAPLDTARQLAARFAVEASARDRERRFPHAELAELKASGLLGLLVPARHGGTGASIGDFVRVVAALAEGDSNIAQMFSIHCVGVELLDLMRTSDEAKAPLYRKALDGLMFANGYSERGTRTVFEMKTRIEPDGRGNWLLSGRKSYCTGSLGADVLYVSGLVGDPAGTGVPANDLGAVRMAYLDPATPGVTIHDDWTGMGQRTTSSGTIDLEQAPVAADMVFSTEGLDGQDNLIGAFLQSPFAAVCLGIAKAALAAAGPFVRERARPWAQSGVDRAAEDPYVLQRFGELAIAISTAEGAVARMADALDEANERRDLASRSAAGVAVAIARAVTTDVSLKVGQGIFQVCGASATTIEHNLDRFWRDARTLTLHDPVDYKLKLVGDWALNSTPPPATGYS